MTTLRIRTWSALSLAVIACGSAHAGWQGVFQATCFHRSSPAVVQYTPPVVSAPVVSAAPVVSYYEPPQVYTVQYVQRCYYQPVTTYRPQTYYEQVTSYRTSYYYEPVVTWRYRYRWDWCTWSFYEAAVPRTSYRLRAQVSPVVSYVQRVAYVPVTSYYRSCYLEPQVTSGPVILAPPSANGEYMVPPPGVREQRTSPPSSEPRSNGQPAVPPPEGSGSLYRQSAPPAAPTASPARLDRIAYDLRERPASASLTGQVIVEGSQALRPGDQVLFVHTHWTRRATADERGRAVADLPAGRYAVYVQTGTGKPQYRGQLDIQPNEVQQVALSGGS